MKRTIMKTSKKFQEAVEAFYKLYKIGTELIYDFGAEHVRTLQSEALVGTNRLLQDLKAYQAVTILNVKHKMKRKSIFGMSYLVPRCHGVAI